jgi:hypothetical protein
MSTPRKEYSDAVFFTGALGKGHYSIVSGGLTGEDVSICASRVGMYMSLDMPASAARELAAKLIAAADHHDEQVGAR